MRSLDEHEKKFYNLGARSHISSSHAQFTLKRKMIHLDHVAAILQRQTL